MLEVSVAAAPAREFSDGLLPLSLLLLFLLTVAIEEGCFCAAAIRAVIPFPLLLLKVEDERDETSVTFAKNVKLVVLPLLPSGPSATDACSAK